MQHTPLLALPSPAASLQRSRMEQSETSEAAITYLKGSFFLVVTGGPAEAHGHGMSTAHAQYKWSPVPRLPSSPPALCHKHPLPAPEILT